MAPVTRILIIEHDMELSDQLAELLQGQGFIVEQCAEGQQGLSAALGGAFDLVLLTIVLPSFNGFLALSQLRQSSQTPVMVLGASSAAEERIQSYQRGADDYLLKPFTFTEILVRIDALLRRCRWNHCGGSSSGNHLNIDGLHLDRLTQQATFAEINLGLTQIQFRLLWALAENQHKVLSKPYLYQTVLERAFSRYDRSLDMHLSRIRRKLVDAGMMPERFATIHGKGYRFA